MRIDLPESLVANAYPCGEYLWQETVNGWAVAAHAAQLEYFLAMFAESARHFLFGQPVSEA